MIARNEATKLRMCLSPVRGLFHEIVVADTGSTDGTAEIARELGARVVTFAWRDDFAAARNAALDHATGAWAFFLDADEFVDEVNVERIRSLLRSLGTERVGYTTKCVSLEADGGTRSSVDQVRLFPKMPEVRWEHRIHEQIAGAVLRAGGRLVGTDVVVFHRGYADPALVRQKTERNLRILDLEYEGQPLHPVNLFHRGTMLLELDRSAEAIVALNLANAVTPAGSDLHRLIYASLAEAYIQEELYGNAATAISAGRCVFPEDLTLMFLDAELLAAQGELEQAEVGFQHVAAGRGDRVRTVPVDGSLVVRAEHALGRLCLLQSRYAEAETHALAALSIRPSLDRARFVLGEALLGGSKMADFDALSAGVTRDAERAVLHVLRALYLDTVPEALALADDALQRHPADLFLVAARARVLSPRDTSWTRGFGVL